MGQGNLLQRLPWYTAPAILVGVPLLAWLVTLAMPEFYRDVIWKYYWGPIKADAMNVRSLTFEGVAATSGYNLVNTLSWAALLGVCMLGTAQMLGRLRARMDTTLVVGATAWVVAGSLFHVLEDTQLFATPLQYFFITPPIYLLFAAGGILSFLVAHYLRAIAAHAGVVRALQKLWLLLGILALLYLTLWLKGWGQVQVYLNPLVVVGSLLVGFLVVRHRAMKAGEIDANEFVLHMAIAPFLVACVYLWRFSTDPWFPSHDAAPYAFYVAPALALGLILVVRLLARGPGAFAVALRQPVNLLIIFGQMLDGFATALGIDLVGYEEKHVLSAGIIEVFRDFATGRWAFAADHATFFAFVPVKFAVSLLVIYAIDVSGKKDDSMHPNLVGLVKFAVIMVGIGPGVRDFVRMGLGV